MERKNWIWFAVAFAVVAIFGAGVSLLRSGAKHIAPELSAPPPLQIEEAAQTPQSTEEPAPEQPPAGVLDLTSLYARCQAVLDLAAGDETLGVDPVEEVELIDAGAASGVRFARAFRRPPEEVDGERRYYYRGDRIGAYALSDASASELRLCGGDGEEPTRFSRVTFARTEVPAFVIACGSSCLRLEGDELTVSEARLATRWAEEPETGFWYTITGGKKRYLNSDGLGEEGMTRWTLDGGVLRGQDVTGVYELIFDGDWMLSNAGAFYLADSEGRCLNMDETGVLPETGRRTRWIFERDNTGAGGYFRTYLNGKRYTLCLRDGQLILSTEPFADYWVYRGGSMYIYRDNVNYYLNYRAGAWRAESMLGWRISDGQHYLSADGDRLTDETQAEHAALWRIDEAGDGVVISTGEDESRYLGYEEGQLLLLSGQRPLWQRREDSLYCDGGALRFQDRWRLGEAGDLRFAQVLITVPTVQELETQETAPMELLQVEDMQLVEAGEESELPAGALCCVPIACDDSLAASADNPGYLCPGRTPMRLVSMAGAGFARDLDVGTIQALTRGVSDGALRPARADEGEFGLNCRRFLESVADGGPWGLRMAGALQAEDTAMLPLAVFGGQCRRDLELVRGGVALCLAQQGTLSVFAAGGEGGLLTLYSVERDAEGRVAGLRGIDRMFRGESQLVYDYADGGLPVREDAELVFDAAWLREGTDQSALYYFEIPLNAGEYVLGPASEEGGAVLLYLALSEEALASAPEAEAAEDWDALSDRALLTFLCDGANAAALGERLRENAAGALVDRVGRIADDGQRDRAAELLDVLLAEAGQTDWRSMSDAVFVEWLCDPGESKRIQSLLEQERGDLTARVEVLASHDDYLRAWDRLKTLVQAG